MLTDERISELFNEWFRREKGGDTYAECWNACARAIEAVALQAQEPIGYVGRHIAHAIQGGSAGLTTITQHQAFDDDVALYTAPQPPASCPKRIELEPVAYSWVSPSLERTMLGDKPLAAWIGARDIYTLVRQSDASAIIAGKDVEIKTLRVENDALAKSAAAAGNKCDALQAKVAELEKVAKAYEDQVAAHNKTLDELKYTGLAAAAEARRGDELQSRVAAQAALIEKCEKALSVVDAHYCGSLDFQHPYVKPCREALAAITAQKGGSK